MAIACFRLLTFVLPPDLRLPRLYSCITLETFPRPRADDFRDDEPFLAAEDRFLVLAMESFSYAFRY